MIKPACVGVACGSITPAGNQSIFKDVNMHVPNNLVPERTGVDVTAPDERPGVGNQAVKLESSLTGLQVSTVGDLELWESR